MTTKREEVVLAARSCIGTPFRHLGRRPGLELDCVGLLVYACWATQLKPTDFDVTGYSRFSNPSELRRLAELHLRPITLLDAVPGDVVMTATDVDPQHFGILGNYMHGGLSLIHATNSISPPHRVVEHRLMWSRAMKFVAAFVLPGVE